MDKQILMYIPITISITSVLISIIAYYHSVKSKKKEHGFRLSNFTINRNLSFEEKLFSWKGAFELYGIDLNEAKKDGVTQEHIAYLVLCLNAQSATAEGLGISVLDHIHQSKWRQNMYRQSITKKTWKYARQMFEDFTVKDVDEYLAKIDSKTI